MTNFLRFVYVIIVLFAPFRTVISLNPLQFAAATRTNTHRDHRTPIISLQSEPGD